MSIAAPNPTAPAVTYAGLDVAKATLALHLAGLPHNLPNTPAGHARLVRLLRKQPGVHLVCEASGGYEQGPVRALWAAGLPVSVVEAGRIRHYARACGRRAKNDPVDAAVIAGFGAAVRPRPTPPPGAVAERLAALGLAVDFHKQLAKKAIRSLKGQYPGDYHLAVLVCDFEGNFICRVDEEDAL